jgi:hypothetical protein
LKEKHVKERKFLQIPPMPFILLFALAIPVFCACNPGQTHYSELPGDTLSPPPAFIDPKGIDLSHRFPAPQGYERPPAETGSFAAFLRALPLKPDGSPVLYYHGGEKTNNGDYAAVVDWPIENRDIQQCADAIIRLRANYLYEQKRFEAIHFNFSNGFRADYSEWRKGNRIQVDGNAVSWRSTSARSDTDQSFRDYLRIVFAYANTASLERELQSVSPADLRIGDVFIQGGYPGHAVIVADMAVHAQTGEKIFLLAQSFMPAQEIHVLQNLQGQGLGPWYRLDTGREDLHTPSWTFRIDQLRRFAE